MPPACYAIPICDERAEADLALSRGRLAWLEGDLARARDLVARALHAFEARDDRFYVIAALTDLCTLELEAGEDAKALDLARQLLPALRFLGADAQWRKPQEQVPGSCSAWVREPVQPSLRGGVLGGALDRARATGAPFEG